jgi:plasmid stabilization system protein ParE
VEVTNQGTDAGELGPALDRLERAFGRRPAEMLADGGYVSLAEIDDLAACGTVLYAPPMTGRPRADQRSHGRRLDSPAVAAWRERMATDEGQLIYRLRAATAEWVNALARNRGLQQYRVRGLERVRSVLLWFALAHNLDRTLAIRARATG